MPGPEQRTEQRIFIPIGGELRVVLEGGTVLDIRNPKPTSFVIEHRVLSPREIEREELKTEFPDALLGYAKAALDQHGYKFLGGEEISGEMTLMEKEQALRDWMNRAKSAGISNREILQGAEDVLKQISVGAPRMGEIPPLIKGVNTKIDKLVREVWGEKRPKR